jgi:hypothetical protein
VLIGEEKFPPLYVNSLRVLIPELYRNNLKEVMLILQS